MSGRLKFQEEEEVVSVQSNRETFPKRSPHAQHQQGQSSYHLYDLTNDEDDRDHNIGNSVNYHQPVPNQFSSMKKTIVVIDDENSDRYGNVSSRTLEIMQSLPPGTVVQNFDTEDDRPDHSGQTDDGIATESEIKKRKKRNKKSKKKNNSSQDDVKIEGSDVNTTANVEDLSKKDQMKKDTINLDYNEQDVDIGTSTLVENLVEFVDVAGDIKTNQATIKSNTSVSGWLGKFLSQKRSRIEDHPVEDLGPSHDTFLQLFNEDFRRDTEVNTDHLSESDSSDKDEEEGSQHLALEAMKDFSFVDDTTVLCDNLDCITGIVHFYNLPYKINEDDVRKFVASSCEIKIRSITVGTAEKKKGMPLGSAAVEFVLPNDDDDKGMVSSKIKGDGFCTTLEEVIDALNGKMCGGRPVRAQKPSSTDVKRRISFGAGSMGGRDITLRYFVTDISCKCNSCGQVGHRQQECINDPLPIPCHFCAGCDHDAGDCPNIICYRCGKFGHHSRDCRSGNRARPIVCFQCGSLQHDMLKCPELTAGQEPASRYDSKVEDVYVRCMNCNNNGHVMCHRMPWDRQCDRKRQRKSAPSQLFCPNCGQMGHHIDFPPQPDDRDYYDLSKYCKAPKCEAYFRYPRLRDMDNILQVDYDNEYRNMVKNPNDLSLFPSLSIPSPRVKLHQRFGSTNGRRSSRDGVGTANSRRIDYDYDDYGGYGNGDNYNDQSRNRYDSNSDRRGRDYVNRHENRGGDRHRGGSNGRVSSYFSGNNGNSINRGSLVEENSRPTITVVGDNGGNRKRTFDDGRDDAQNRGKRSKPSGESAGPFSNSGSRYSDGASVNSSYQLTKEWQEKVESRKKRFAEN